MINSNEIIVQYFQAKQALEQVASEQYPILNDLDTELSRDKCPTQDETRFILFSLKEFALCFASYLERIRELAKSPAVVVELVKSSDREIGPTEQCLRTLGLPYGIAINLHNSFYEKKLPTTKHWDRVFELAQWYAYFGSTFSINSSLLSLVWSVKRDFDNKESNIKLIELLCQHIVSVVPDEHLAGLRYISNRALFLLGAKADNEIEAGDVDWWCAKIDSSFYDHYFRTLLEYCPNPHDKKVVAKLNELIKSKKELSQETLEQISLFLKNGG